MSDPLESFVDIDVPWEDESTPLADRSTLEAWATCPAMARMKEQGMGLAGLPAASGNEVHDAISEIITDYLDCGEAMSRADLRQLLTDRIRYARPDVQPDAIQGMAAWLVAEVIYEAPTGGIIRYDGGEGERSGQLAFDVNGVRVTGEVDLLLATMSPDVLRIVDWKSGWGAYSIERVASEFQCQVYAWLCFMNFDVQRVDFVVVNTRKRFCTPRVSFERGRDLQNIQARIERSVTAMKTWQGRDDAPAWPAPEKCRWCDVALSCKAFVPSQPAATMIRTDPALAVDALVAYERLHDLYIEELTAIRAQTGEPIVGHSGAVFDYPKPTTRKQKPRLLEGD